MKKLSIYLILIIVLLSSCNFNEFKKTPIDELIVKMNDIPVYSIILFDMNAEGFFFQKYFHQYKIVKDNNGNPVTETTDWFEVSEEFFAKHQNDLGMTIVYKSDDGKITKVASPPGYGNYIGNEKYGQWKNNSDGTSFWEFYGQYAFLSSIFNLMSYPVYRDSYSTYDRSYRGSRPYYGSSSGTGKSYGTGSTYSSKTNPTSTWNRKLETRKSSSTFASKTSRNSSRYSFGGSSGSRSRSFGFGK